jgi:hypothetical protein
MAERSVIARHLLDPAIIPLLEQRLALMERGEPMRSRVA